MYRKSSLSFSSLSSELISSDALFSEPASSCGSLWDTPDPDNVEMTKIVFDYSGYKNVAKINIGLFYEKEFEAKVREFAELYGFEVVEGSP